MDLPPAKDVAEEIIRITATAPINKMQDRVAAIIERERKQSYNEGYYDAEEDRKNLVS
jgi:hypothetical protein